MERRIPYTTRTLPRQPWPDETATRLEPPAADELEIARLIHSEVLRLQTALDQARQRIAALEAAAREVCGPHECIGLLFEAIEELSRVVREGTGQ